MVRGMEIRLDVWRSHLMSLKSLIRKPLAIALIGAASVGVPVSALYFGSIAHAAPSAAVAAQAPAPAATARPPATTPTLALPDFSGMVQQYGPAVVNITVTAKTSAAWQGDPGDENGDNGDNGNGNGNEDPFGPN